MLPITPSEKVTIASLSCQFHSPMRDLCELLPSRLIKCSGDQNNTRDFEARSKLADEALKLTVIFLSITARVVQN
jgi:hypothetical protein